MRNSKLSSAVPLTPAAAAQFATDNIAGSGGLKYNPFNVAPNQIVDINGKINPNAQLIWGNDLDWTKEISRVGNRDNYNMSYSGGNEKTDFYGSVGYTNEEGYVPAEVVPGNHARFTATQRRAAIQTIQSRELHHQLREDLIEHLWQLKGDEVPE